jgi:hypothetical protein
MRLPADRAARRGTVLVYFALIAGVLLAVAALVIDLGLAFVARRQLQTATDSVALDTARGVATGDANAFIDANVPAQRTVRFQGGIPLEGMAFDASPLMTLDRADAPARAVSSGSYQDGPDVRHVERPDGSRDDFVPAPSPGGAALVQGNQLSPYLFSRGLFLQSPRKLPGIVVRATSVATTRVQDVLPSGGPTGQPPREVGRVRSVGVPLPPSGGPPDGQQTTTRPGVTPFVLYLDNWNTLTTATLGTDNDGTVRLTTPAGTVAAGHVIATQPVTIGQTLPVGSPTGFLQRLPPLFGYVPVVLRDPNAPTAPTGVVVGFGWVNVQVDGRTQQVSITKQAGEPAPDNASAAISQSLLLRDGVAPAVLLQALSTNQDQLAFRDSLLVPVLVRTIGPLR